MTLALGDDPWRGPSPESGLLSSLSRSALYNLQQWQMPAQIFKNTLRPCHPEIRYSNIEIELIRRHLF